jgi:hypothetical protein
VKTRNMLELALYLQGGSNMTGTNCDLFTHNQSRSYLNHFVCNFLLFNCFNRIHEHKALVGKPEGRRALGRPRRRWEDNIKMDLR